MLNATQTEQLDFKMQAREAQLVAKLQQSLHERVERDNSELDAGGGDDSEQSVADLMEGVDTGLLSQETEELNAIRVARAALREGAYGRCSDCGETIDFPRLLAVPTARRCLACQEANERNSGHSESTL